MPNEDLDIGNLEALEKSRSFKPKTDINVPREKLLRAKEIKARKKIPRKNRQNAELERAVWLRTALIPLDEVRAERGRAAARSTSSAWPSTARCFVTCSEGPSSPPGHLEGGVQPGRRVRRAGLLWEHGDSVRSFQSSRSVIPGR
ncbi:39S ribosomal protein L38, mitochondrial-like [Columba livia]|uniref:39S ribosomal protein L38, mitochondrial-like n=1 Tax=Columba livia TaxID=8932 RepID=A0A2I0LGX9_COLLI|nr:39S ribosomal protein L38, mitochondrial-like [Columba livia]